MTEKELEEFKEKYGAYPGDVFDITCPCGNQFQGYIDDFGVCGLCQIDAIEQIKKDLGRM